MRKPISTFHNPDLTARVVDAFSRIHVLKHPHFVWDRVAEILKSKKHYTLVLSGKTRLDWEETASHFPHFLVTNQLTNPKIYPVIHNAQDDISIIGVGTDSHIYTGLGRVIEIYTSGERGGPSGWVAIRFGKNRELMSSGEENDYERQVTLRGDVSSGFLLSHADGKLYTIEDAYQFLE